MAVQSSLSVLNEIETIWKQPLQQLLNQSFLPRNVDLAKLSRDELPNLASYPAKQPQDYNIDLLTIILECAKIEPDAAKVILQLDNEVEVRVINHKQKSPLAAAPYYMVEDIQSVLKHLQKEHRDGKSIYKQSHVPLDLVQKSMPKKGAPTKKSFLTKEAEQKRRAEQKEQRENAKMDKAFREKHSQDMLNRVLERKFPGYNTSAGEPRGNETPANQNRTDDNAADKTPASEAPISKTPASKTFAGKTDSAGIYKSDGGITKNSKLKPRNMTTSAMKTSASSTQANKTPALKTSSGKNDSTGIYRSKPSILESSNLKPRNMKKNASAPQGQKGVNDA